jgi:RNA polymerase sigma-70 factor (ECF subfamily)
MLFSKTTLNRERQLMAEAKAKASKPPDPLTEATLERYACGLQRFFSRRVRRAQDAGDMVQEVFARFLRKKDRPEVIRNPFGYLIAFANNVLLESLRDEQHNPVVYNSDLAELVGRELEDTSPREPMGERERQLLLDALADLPENYLIAIMLVDGKGMSYEEAAAASGFTKATIATYVMRARADLRLKLPDFWTESFR